MPDEINNPALRDELQGFSGVGFFADLLPRLIQLGFIVGAIIFFFMLATGAIQWMFSGGDKAAVESARAKITNAIIGIVILLSVFAIVVVVENFFGINITNLDIRSLELGNYGGRSGASGGSGGTAKPI